MELRRHLRLLRAAIAGRAEALHLYSVHMSRRDSARWASAQDLADLGELVIEWLNGGIQMTPGHLGPPAPETIPLVPALIAANRAGFITNGSRLGKLFDAQCHRCGGSLAWVEGFATDEILARLHEMVLGTRLRVLACRREFHCEHGEAGWMRCPWDECTEFWSEASPVVTAALRSCWYAIVIDPEPGRNTHLWPLLEGLGVPWRAA